MAENGLPEDLLALPAQFAASRETVLEAFQGVETHFNQMDRRLDGMEEVKNGLISDQIVWCRHSPARLSR